MDVPTLKLGWMEYIMAKNQINFSKMTETAKKQLDTFKSASYLLASEDLRYKAEKKSLQTELNLILKNRQNDLDNGLSLDDVVEKFPRIEVDRKIKVALDAHNATNAPLNEMLKESYVFIPDGMYEAYLRKINDGKRGDFLVCIRVFLDNLGIEELKQGQINKFAERMSDMFGSKYATSKSIVNDGKYTTVMKKQTFNKLFMAVFCDMAM